MNRITVQTSAWRGANLVVYELGLGEHAQVQAMAYYQPDLETPADYHVQGTAAVEVELAEGVSLATTLDWRADSRPPGGLERDDIRLRTGITLTLR